jgi:hypothetical protein
MIAGDTNRSYLVAEPPRGAPVSAVVMSLHGTRSTAARQARLFGFEELAQTASAVVYFGRQSSGSEVGLQVGPWPGRRLHRRDRRRAPRPTSDASWSRAPHRDVRRCSHVRRCRPGMGAAQRHHGSTGGSRREPDPHPDDQRCGRATRRGDAVDVTRGRSHLARRAPRAAAEPLPWPHVPRDRRHQVDLGVRATPRRRSVTAVTRSDRGRQAGIYADTVVSGCGRGVRGC